MPALLPLLIASTLAAQGPTWMQVANNDPLGRSGAAMAYDSQRARTVLCGGFHFNGNTNHAADTWEWDGATWYQVSTTGPGMRVLYGLAFDSQRNRTVLFGGMVGGTQTYFGDTWEWDGASWVQVGTSGPSARERLAMAFDSQRGHIVLFGGRDANGLELGDTWTWDGASWSQLSVSGPAARHRHAMAHDSQRGRSVLFGGEASSVLLGDTWEWDGNAWSQVATTGPSARWGHAMAYDTQRGLTVLFGGYAGGNLGDTWEWDGTTWSLEAPAGAVSRVAHAMAYDSRRGRTVMFGGGSSSTGYPRDTWEWAGRIVGSATTFGTGCGNPALTLSPIPSARPLINTTGQCSLTNIPSSIAFVAVGWNRNQAFGLPLPLSLTPYGMPGCELLQSTNASLLVPVSGGSATFGLPLANSIVLVGLNLYLQGWALAPGANAVDLIVSNGVEWYIGNT